VAAGAFALDIRDKDEHDAGHIPESLHISRGKLEINVEAALPDLDQQQEFYANRRVRAACSPSIGITARPGEVSSSDFGGWSGQHSQPDHHPDGM
jgi:hypothetical protein